MKSHTYPTGRFNTVALVAVVCILNTSSPGVKHFQEKCSTISTPFKILEHSCLVPSLRKKKKPNPHNCGKQPYKAYIYITV